MESIPILFALAATCTTLLTLGFVARYLLDLNEIDYTFPTDLDETDLP